MTTAAEIIEALGLAPHPEGGHYAETFRDAPDGGRGYSTAIYFLLAAGEYSRWHRVLDAAEVWHYYAGDPLTITLSADGETATSVTLGPDILAGERPQVVVPAGHWQTAEPRGAWTLVGCTVAPGFAFEAFEMAAPDWEPTTRYAGR